MRRTIIAAAAALAAAAGPALAEDSNYNVVAAMSTNNDGRANCHSATMQGDCDDGFFAASLVEAPLPLAGAGPLGGILLAVAGLAAGGFRRQARA